MSVVSQDLAVQHQPKNIHGATALNESRGQGRQMLSWYQLKIINEINYRAEMERRSQ